MIAALLGEGLPWLMLAMVAVSAAVLTMIGRLGFGPTQARASRYVTFAVMLPIALLALRANGSFALDSFIFRARPTSDQSRVLSPAYPIHPHGLPKLSLGSAGLAGVSASAPLWKGTCFLYQFRA